MIFRRRAASWFIEVGVPVPMLRVPPTALLLFRVSWFALMMSLTWMKSVVCSASRCVFRWICGVVLPGSREVDWKCYQTVQSIKVEVIEVNVFVLI